MLQLEEAVLWFNILSAFMVLEVSGDPLADFEIAMVNYSGKNCFVWALSPIILHYITLHYIKDVYVGYSGHFWRSCC